MSQQTENFAQSLFKLREQSFERILDSICEDIVRTEYCGKLLSSENRSSEIREIETTINRLIQSERETFLTSMMQLLNQNTNNRAIDPRLEALRPALNALSRDANALSKLSTTCLLNQYFFEASFVKSNALKMRRIILDFTASFQQTFGEFKKKVHDIMKAVQNKQIDDDSATMDKLKSRLESKSHKYKLIKETLKKAHTELTRLKSVIEQRQDEQILDFRYEDLQQKFADLQWEFDHVKEEKEILMREIAEKTDALRSFAEVKGELANADMKRELIEQKAASLQQKCDALTQENSELKKEKSLLEKKVKEHSKVAIKALKQVESLKRELHTQTTERIALDSQIKTLESKNLEHEESTKLQREVTRLNNRLKQVQAELNAAANMNDRNEAEIRRLQSTIDASKRELDDKNKTIEELSVLQQMLPSYTHTSPVKQPKQAVSTSMINPNSDLFSAVSAMNTQRDQMITDLSEQYTDLQSRFGICQEELNEQSTKAYIAEHEAKQALTKMKNLASSFARAKTEISHLKKQLSEKEAELREAAERHSDLNHLLEEKTEENNHLSEEIRRLFVTKRSSESDLETKLNNTISERNALEIELNTMKNDKIESEKQMKLLNKNLRKKTREAEKLSDRIMVLKREMIAIHTVKSEAIVDCANKTADTVSENKKLQRTIEDLQAEITYLTQAKSKSQTLLTETTNAYESEIQRLTEQIDSVRASSEGLVKSIKAENATLKNRLGKCDQKQKDAKFKIDDLERSLQHHKTRLERSAETLKARDQLIQELRDHTEGLQFLYDQASEIIFGKDGKRHSTGDLLTALKCLKAGR